MSTHLVVVATGVAPEERDAIKQFLRREGVAFWGHLPEAWLVVDRRERSPGWWRGVFKRRAVNATVLVMAVKPAGWSAVGSPRMFPWLHDNWKADDNSHIVDDD